MTMTDARKSLTQVAIARTKSRTSRIDWERWDNKLEARSKEHRGAFPLPESVKNEIRTAYRSGEPLCCKRGRLTLEATAADHCWVDFINKEAYERLGCDESWKPGGRYFEEGKEKLERILRGEES